MAITPASYGRAYKTYSSSIKIRSEPNPKTSTNIIGSFTLVNDYFYYTEVSVSAASSSDYFVKIAPNQGYAEGWVACSSGTSPYIYYKSSQYSGCYLPTEQSGSAINTYMWPISSTEYKTWKTETRYDPVFTLPQPKASHYTIKNTESKIVLTIKSRDSSGASVSKTQQGITWTGTKYKFFCWSFDIPTQIPGEPEGGFNAGFEVTSENSSIAYKDNTFYPFFDSADGTETGYSNNSATLTTPSNYQTSQSYIVTLNNTELTNNKLTYTNIKNYRFSKWTNSSGNKVVSPYTFTKTETITANYTESIIKGSVTLPTPTKSGYKLLGWATAENSSTIVYGDGATISGDSDLDLWAVWTPDGSIRIYINDTNKYKIALVYIHNGTSWKLATPYLYNGTAWKIAGG